MAQPPEPSEPSPASDPEAASRPLGHYGPAPDPTGAYPQPEQGGFTLLPSVDEGDYRPPGPGYSGADAEAGSAQATDSLRRAWRLFAANWQPFVLSQLIWGVIIALPALLLLAAFGVLRLDRSAGITAGLSALAGVGGLVVVLVVVLLTVVQQGAFATATLKAVDGVRVGIGDFFRPRHLAQLVLLALILGLAAALLAVTGIGPLVVMFFGIWAVLLVVDRGLPAVEALRAGVTASLRNPGQTIVLVLAAYLMNAVGVLLCGIGTLVSTPVGVLAFADYYRRSPSFTRR